MPKNSKPLISKVAHRATKVAAGALAAGTAAIEAHRASKRSAPTPVAPDTQLASETVSEAAGETASKTTGAVETYRELLDQAEGPIEIEVPDASIETPTGTETAEGQAATVEPVAKDEHVAPVEAEEQVDEDVFRGTPAHLRKHAAAAASTASPAVEATAGHDKHRTAKVLVAAAFIVAGLAAAGSVLLDEDTTPTEPTSAAAPADLDEDSDEDTDVADLTDLSDGPEDSGDSRDAGATDRDKRDQKSKSGKNDPDGSADSKPGKGPKKNHDSDFGPGKGDNGKGDGKGPKDGKGDGNGPGKGGNPDDPDGTDPDSEGAFSSLLDPIIGDLVATLDGSTGGATAPVTGPVNAGVDDLTDALDPLASR